MTSIGRTFPAAGRLFYDAGPRKAHQIIADWIALHQKAGNIRDDADPHRLAVLFHDMLIGEHQLSWLTSASSDKDRAKRVDQTVRLAVTMFLQGCALPLAGSARHPVKARPIAAASPTAIAITFRNRNRFCDRSEDCCRTALRRRAHAGDADCRTRPPARNSPICQNGREGADCVP